jgi:Flp pilus assembly protein TadD
MEATQIEGLIDLAGSAIQKGDWQAAIEALAQANEMNPGDAGLLTGLGTCLVRVGRPADAVPYLQQAAATEPPSTDAYNNLGVTYGMLKDFEQAEHAYKAALAVSSEYSQAWKNLAYLYLQQEDRQTEGVQILATLLQKNPADIEVNLLLADCYEAGDKVDSARVLYQNVLKYQPDNAAALAALERLPLLETVDAADITRIARPEHAKKLAGLKNLIKKPAAEPAVVSPTSSSRVALYTGDSAFTGARLDSFAQALKQNNIAVQSGQEFTAQDLNRFDTFVFSNPQLSSTLLNGVMSCANAGKRVVVDVSEDAHHMPAEHPAFNLLGPGNPGGLTALENILKLAQVVTVPTVQLAETYHAYASRVEIIPDLWSQANPLWDKPPLKRPTINLGWYGTSLHRADFAIIKQDLVRLLREVPEALLVICGDTAVYESFGSISEKKRLLLPMPAAEDLPYTLAQFDILIYPLRNTPYNRSLSDFALVEAGVRRIPWVSSPLPNVLDWEAGGLVTAKPGDWFAALKRLTGDRALCTELGQAGRKKAEDREVSHWLEAYQHIL